MKVLVFYVKSFQYTPQQKSLDIAPDSNMKTQIIEDAILAFIHLEPSDQEMSLKSRDKKLANHLKWCCRKNDTKNVVIHSFAHLAEAKADWEYTRDMLNLCEERLKSVGYETHQTPFGYFLDLKIDAPGHSLARLWKTL
ncbi:threonyl-tRNA synthetase editing domain-containing protein [Halosquirtibacter xylanolyticus]|uniref:threonyl-tRNA synthetase editing domain-containing protein n=1 Tax=Halosquirtibacter xylanolyticus TaxID=3374599 RepID=UPI003748C3B7|nr:threonyl-tRNA synthetase editing domain-containing protein [Prolixibacteraceae bacterium]